MTRKMNTKLSIALLALFFMSSCVHHDDFEFTGIVVDYEPCQGAFELGYVVSLTSPDTIGGDYINQEGDLCKNAVVIYGADRQLHPNDNISGKIYLDPNYSATTCNYHFDRDIPEAVFTKLKKD